MQFEGIYTPLVTPYHEDFSLNEGALEIGRAHVRTPVTSLSRMPSSA